MLFLIKNSHYTKNSKVMFQPFCILLCFCISASSFASEGLFSAFSSETVIQETLAQENVLNESVLDKQASTVELTTQALQKMQVLLGDHLQEWNEMKPALKRLIKSEQDLASIVAALDKMSPLAAAPTEQQLLKPKTLHLPKKQTEAAKLPEKDKIAISNQKNIEKPLKSTPNASKKVVQEKIDDVKQVVKCPPSKESRTGIHLASYKKTKNVQRGWSVLENKFSKILKGKAPFYYQVKIGSTLYTRLVVGSFDSTETARKACQQLKEKGQYCQVINYTITTNKL